MGTHVTTQDQPDGAFWRRAAQVARNARFELVLLVLLLATIAAVTLQERILTQTVRLTPADVAGLARKVHTDATVGGSSTARETGPFAWTCDLNKQGFDYPYCGNEIFFASDADTKGLDLTNFKSLTVRLVYRGEGKSFRVHLKNYDPRYSKEVSGDSSKFNRVEFETTPGREQTVTFTFADFGVADWWLTKHKLAPALSHPQFDNIVSLDIQSGTEIVLGRHEFEVREVVMRRALLSDAQWYLSLLGFWVVLIGAYLAYRITYMKKEIERRRVLEGLAVRQAEEAEAAARQDHLTKVLNRRGIAERFDGAVAKGSGDAGLAVILIDIDRFKQLNDSFGHGYGDEVLSTVATVIRRNLREGDSLARWGGEEFLVLCPNIDSVDAQHIAEKLRRRIEHFHFGDCEKVTVSLGVHWVPAATSDADLPALVSLADVALYSAKRSGRNCARLYRPGMAKAA
jgi:diguanylate cyclase (GGDEF)-like protein